MGLAPLKYCSLQFTTPKRNSRQICDDYVMRACNLGGKRAVERVNMNFARWLMAAGGQEGCLGDEKPRLCFPNRSILGIKH